MISIKKLKPIHWIILFIVWGIGLHLIGNSVRLFVAERYHREGYFFAQRGYARFAVTELEQAVKNAPWETRFKLELGKSMEQLATSQVIRKKRVSQYLSIIPLYMDIIDKTPNNPWYKNRLSYLYHQLMAQQPDKKELYMPLAEKYSFEAAQMDSKNPLFLVSYAQLLHSALRYDEAIPYYEKVFTYDSKMLEAPYNLGDIYFRKGLTKKSLEKYLFVYDSNPDYQYTRTALGQIYLLTNNYPKAIAILEVALKKHPTHSSTSRLLAYAYHNTRRFKEATTLYRDLLKQTPNDKALINLLRSASQNKRPKK
ncbi:tetratricopeptide repeat protein [bacterium]|nr:tetratricopeptide repeat protein [bacterium]